MFALKAFPPAPYQNWMVEYFGFAVGKVERHAPRMYVVSSYPAGHFWHVALSLHAVMAWLYESGEGMVHAAPLDDDADPVDFKAWLKTFDPEAVEVAW
jgi:hypothetical protein